MLYHIVALAAYHIHISIWSNDDILLNPGSKYCKKEHVPNDTVLHLSRGSEQAERTPQMLGIVRQSLSSSICHHSKHYHAAPHVALSIPPEHAEANTLLHCKERAPSWNLMGMMPL